MYVWKGYNMWQSPNFPIHIKYYNAEYIQFDIQIKGISNEDVII